MSLSGSIVLIAYFMARPILTKYFPPVLKYNILKISMLLYILPIDTIINLFTKTKYIENSFIDVDLIKSIQTTPEIIILLDRYEFTNIVKLVILLWILVLLYFAVKNVLQYIRLKKIFTIGTSMPDSSTLQLLSSLKWHYKIKTDIILKKTRFISSPITFGFIKPIILLPEIPMENIELKIALSHELIHIKHHDIRMKLTCLLIMMLHWFNPFCYLLSRELNNVSEFNCDESVVRNLSTEHRKIYGNLLLRLSDYKFIGSHIFISTLGKSSHILKERIIGIIKTRKYGKWNLLASSIILVLFTTIGATTVYASNSFQLILEFKNQQYYLNNGNGVIYSYSKSNSTYANTSDQVDIIDTQYYIEDNGIYNVVDPKYLQIENDLCIHSYVPKLLKKHTSFSEGNCSMDILSSKRCVKCGNIKIGPPESSFFNKICPH